MSSYFKSLLISLALVLFSGSAIAELIAHWPLDGNADDALGNHNGAASSIVYGADGAAAHTGTAAEFNGSNSTITIPFSSDLNPDSFTLSMWANADSTGGFASAVTSRDDVAGPITHGYIIYNNNGGDWDFWTGDGDAGWDSLAGPAVATGNWTHLAITYDAATDTKSLWVNGALAVSDNTPQSGPTQYAPNGTIESENLNIGSGADNGSQFYFDGLIDDVALWDEALSLAEIQDVMNNGVPGGPPSVTSLTASPPFVDSGQSTTLSWVTNNATSVNISSLAGNFPAAGSVVVSPTATTTYTLTATGDSPPVAISQITVGVDVESLDPIITEFLADNETGLTDSDGDFSDWIEIHNPNPFAIEIGGWHLSDDPLDPQKYSIPSQQINAGGYLILFASDKQGAVNFLLSKSGDYLALSDPEGNITQEFSPSYPAQFDDVSYGKSNDGSTTYLVPTPGNINGPSRSELGPDIASATHDPTAPGENDDLTISAVISPRIGAITGATLFYRIGFGAEQSISMTAGAGDSFSAIIPSSAYSADDMVRWFLTATTATGETTRAPAFTDPLESAQYFGTVMSDPAISVDQPVMHWFVQKPGAADTRGGTRGSLYFEGQFYDNVFCRIRGQSTANWPKHKYKFDFYRGGHFKWDPSLPRVEEINVNSHYRDSYVRENTIFAFLNEAGALAPDTRYLWIRRNGSDLGLFTFVEQVDEDFLTRRGIDATGSMYKGINVPATLSPTVNSSLYRKALRKTEPYTDLSNLTANINISNPDRFDYVADEVNLPNYINVMAAMCIPFNHDQLTKNYYVYHDLDREEWFRIAWDGDQGLPTGTINTAENWASPLYGDALHTQELQGGNPNPNWQNHLHAAILDNPVTRQMYMRRVRTLMDQYLAIPEAGPSTTILAEGATASYFVPLDNSLESTWFTTTFNDSAWPTGKSAFGYENFPGDYEDLLETVVRPTDTVTGATSIYLRYHFEMIDPAQFQNLILRMRYDDGFSAYLNGALVEQQNITGTVEYNATASSHSDSLAVDFVNFPLAGVTLNAGTNVLAIQIINQSSSSSDLICEPELIDQPGASGGYFENILGGFRNTIANDVVVDQALWSGAGITNFNNGYNGVINTSLPSRRIALFDTYGPGGSGLIPDSQPSDALVNFNQIETNPASGNQDEEFIELANPNGYAVDMSAWTVSGGVDFTLPPGTVVPGNGSIYLSPNVRDFRLRSASPTRGEGNIVVGHYQGHLSNFSETLTLSDASGTMVAQTTTPNMPSDAQQFLVISEIMYHPADGAGIEFIELFNISDSVTLNLEGVAFTRGINYIFPAGTILAPGDYLMIDALDFANGTALSNGGETLKLEDSSRGTIKEFRYEDESPWPLDSDGNGPSLILINPLSNPNPSLASNWRPSVENGGNPNDTDATTFSGDPNGDANQNGVPDLIDYTLGNGGLTTLTPDSLIFQRPIGTDDINLIIESSTDLSTWSDASPFLKNRQATYPGGGIERIEYSLSPTAPTQKLFIRIRAEIITL